MLFSLDLRTTDLVFSIREGNCIFSAHVSFLARGQNKQNKSEVSYHGCLLVLTYSETLFMGTSSKLRQKNWPQLCSADLQIGAMFL